jgi:hypothetical protein
MNIEDIEKFKGVTETGSKSLLNLLEQSEDKLRASPERSEGEAQFSGERLKEFAGKLKIC